MQVFVPYANPTKTAKCLDNRRLNKQILECIQILSANTGIDVGWEIPKYVYNHPNTILWKNPIFYIISYTFNLLNEYIERQDKIHKCNSIMDKIWSKYDYEDSELKHLTPEFCKKHQQILLEKDYNYYIKYFK